MDPASPFSQLFLGENGILAEVTYPAQAKEGRGQVQPQELLLSPRSLPPPLGHWGLWEEGELLGGGCMPLDHSLVHPPEDALTISLEAKLKPFLLCCRQARSAL